MKLLDLFAGIGGFSIAAHWLNWQTVAFVEKDEFCQKVLRKNFKDVPIYDDIRNYKGNEHSADIICGGFPCQPFSSLGHRRGTLDDRALWFEMFRIIQESKPTWIVGENVAGIVAMELDNVLSDLESIGYSAQAFIIPACAIGAEHRRDRVWIVGNSESGGFLPQQIFDRASFEIDFSERETFFSQNSLFEIWDGTNAGINGESDGLSARLDRPRRKTDSRFEPKNESEFRLRALGNSIVPQIAYEIFKAIEYAERGV